ncbi:hypothetical protein CTEN210_04389 [Chaetoceros tenuissimus]|uniref:Uncharacterized protein n=1 Tax=Chaetoceros tenuissimus TaxID=426638 RepID=A0AAD3H2Q3_9STRA|nr:hypothetical protein CTEN210_04389 [Chaetoceros tenuissimus]
MELEDPNQLPTQTTAKKKKPARRRYQPVVASASLQQIRDNMTLDTVKKKTKAETTFYKHQLENVRFIIWLYKNEKYRDVCLVPELIPDLQDKVENQNYDQKFLRRNGRLSAEELEVKKSKYNYTLASKFLREECLNVGGHKPIRQTVIHQNITPDVYGEYLCEIRKGNGSLLRPGVYAGLRSGLTYLFKRYNVKMSEETFEEISEILDGVKRYANEATQAGEGNIEDGKRELTFPLYRAIHKWCIQDGSPKMIHFRFFSECTFNLSCRGDQTGRVQNNHIYWKGDSTGIAFAHIKEDQMGRDPRKRLPRAIFGNPFDVLTDWNSAYFDYLVMFPEVLLDPHGPLFPGSDKNVTNNFSQQLETLLLAHLDELQKLGYRFDDIGIHSWRKAANTFMNNGSTAGPSGTATCIRSGHAIGGSRDVYVLQARGLDGYCGRTLSGRNINKAEFAAGFPDFTDVKEKMTEEEFEKANEDLEKKVMNALNNIFGKETLKRVPNLVPVLHVGLASHLHVRDELEKMYPSDSPIRCTTLFTSPEILDLKKYVKVTMPWEEDGLAYATGVPPHSIILAEIEALKHMLKDQPSQIEKMMDDRVMSGVLSENRMRDLISSEREELMGKIDVLTEMFKKQSCSAVQVQTDANGVNDDGYQYWVVNGIRQKVPPDWTFPNGPIVNVYKYWHHGDANHGIAPLKKFVRSDLTQFDNIEGKKRYLQNFDEVKKVCTMIDQEAVKKDLLKENQTESETVDIYYACKNVLGIPERTEKNRKRNFAKLKVNTVVREWRRLKHKRSDVRL